MLKKNITVISSLNPWNDIRIYKKEIYSLSKYYDVKFICADNKEEISKFNDITFHKLKKPEGISGRFKHLYRILEIVRKDDASVYHIHNPELLLIVPFIKAGKQNSKIIFDMHEDFEEAIKDKKWIPKPLRFIISKFYKYFLKFLMKRQLDYIIVTTPLIKDKFKYSKKVGVIENFAPLINNLPEIRRTPDGIQDKIDKNQDKTKLVFTGLINEQRGIFEVIEAVLQMENVVFFLIGTYPSAFIEKFNQLREQKKLDDKIYLFDSIEYDEMLAVMQQMDIGVLPYLPFGNHLVTRPNKLFEYMMSSIPIISSNYPLYEDVVRRGVGLSVNPCNVEEIRQAISKLSSSPELRREMGNKGFKLYKSNYNWSLEEKKLLNIYNQLLGEEKNENSNARSI